MMITRLGRIGMICNAYYDFRDVCFLSNLVMNFGLYSYELRVRVILSVDGSLNLVSRIRNVNSKPFSFSFAYRTYLSVSDIR